ncbi:hypothetical protein GLOIN_2v1494505, partial [Rhizophagus irregularis DAOM 181602=DAOM 197198]
TSSFNLLFSVSLIINLSKLSPNPDQIRSTCSSDIPVQCLISINFNFASQLLRKSLRALIEKVQRAKICNFFKFEGKLF